MARRTIRVRQLNAPIPGSFALVERGCVQADYTFGGIVRGRPMLLRIWRSSNDYIRDGK